jgi:hypothetical protein
MEFELEEVTSSSKPIYVTLLPSVAAKIPLYIVLAILLLICIIIEWEHQKWNPSTLVYSLHLEYYRRLWIEIVLLSLFSVGLFLTPKLKEKETRVVAKTILWIVTMLVVIDFFDYFFRFYLSLRGKIS